MREVLASALVSGVAGGLLVVAAHFMPGLPHNAAGGVILSARAWLALWLVGSAAGPLLVAWAR